MALSDREQRLLEQMERALASEDPRLSDFLRGHVPARPAAKHLGLAIIALLIGLGAMIAAVAINFAVIGVLGFAVIVSGLAVLVSAPKPERPKVMENLESRWDRRSEL